MSGHQEKGNGDEEVECMRAPEVARALGVSVQTVFTLLRAAKLPGFKLGRTWLVRKRDLEKYLIELATAARVSQLNRKNCA